MHWRLLSPWFRSIDGSGGDECYRFQSPKILEEDALLSQSKPKSAQYGDKLAVKVFRNW